MEAWSSWGREFLVSILAYGKIGFLLPLGEGQDEGTKE
jgi:hypothetical protein